MKIFKIQNPFLKTESIVVKKIQNNYNSIFITLWNFNYILKKLNFIKFKIVYDLLKFDYTNKFY